MIRRVALAMAFGALTFAVAKFSPIGPHHFQAIAAEDSGEEGGDSGGDSDGDGD